MIVYLLPLLVLEQSLGLLVDEFYFHHRRDLNSWERLGNPLDTLTALLCFAFLCGEAPSPSHASIYGALAIFSTLFVLKDESFQLRTCTLREHRLHTIMFLWHPVAYFAAYKLWVSELWRVFLHGQLYFLAFFLVYQLSYWNLLWREKE